MSYASALHPRRAQSAPREAGSGTCTQHSLLSHRFLPASSFSLDTLADLYTRTFADYFYEALVTPQQMARFVRIEHLDLYRSPVLCVGDELVGLATVGLRGDQAYCKGFGLIVPYRGQGLAHELCMEVIRQSRLTGAHRLSLGVMQQNERAVSAYLRAGLRIGRELLSWEWTKTCQVSETSQVSITHAESRELLPHFAALHVHRPTWSRDLPSLLALTDAKGLAIYDGDRVQAYVLYQCSGDGAASIVDIAAIETLHSEAVPLRDATSLLSALQQRYTRLACSNEPAESPALEAFRRAGFGETIRRYEMAMEL